MIKKHLDCKSTIMSKGVEYILAKPASCPYVSLPYVYDELYIHVNNLTFTASSGDLIKILLNDVTGPETFDMARILFFVDNKDENKSSQKYVFVQWMYPEKHVAEKYMLSDHYDIRPIENIYDIYSKLTAVRSYSNLFFNYKTKTSRQMTIEDLLLYKKTIHCWTMYEKISKVHATIKLLTAFIKKK